MEPRITYEIIQRYKCNGGTQCVYCQSPHLEGGPVEVNDGTAIQEIPA